MPDLSIIIVSWNVAEYLAACLRSILEGLEAGSADARSKPTVEIIVVDSNSHDETTAMLKASFPQVRLLAQPENVGFTKGNNIGLEAATGKFILLLNPDTEILEGALQAMIRYLAAHPEVGIVGPHTLNSDGTHQSTRRRFPTLATAYFESTWLEQYAPRHILDRYYVRDADDSATLLVDWVQGSALMFRREVYEQIGGLDEGYIMFSEELDWCRRAKMAGWQVAYLGSARIIHHGGKSSEQVNARRHIHFQESKLRYTRKFHGRAAASLLRLFLIANYVFQWGLESLKGILGSHPQMRRERASTYLEVLRSGLKVT